MLLFSSSNVLLFLFLSEFYTFFLYHCYPCHPSLPPFSISCSRYLFNRAALHVIRWTSPLQTHTSAQLPFSPYSYTSHHLCVHVVSVMISFMTNPTIEKTTSPIIVNNMSAINYGNSDSWRKFNHFSSVL